MSEKPPRLAWVLALGSAVLAMVHAYVHHRHASIDDAFITFRYASHLAAGEGLVFNPGERVEGTSTLLFAFLLAVCAKVDADVVIAAKVLGTIGYGALTITVFALALRFLGRGRWPLALASALVVAAATPLAFYAMSGMEMVVYLALVCGSLLAYLSAYAQNDSRRWAGLLLGLLALTRPEGFSVFLVLFGLDCCVLLQRTRRLGWHASGRLAASFVGAFACVFVPMLVLRLSYFGALLPNTVLAKSGASARLLVGAPLEVVARIFDGAGARMVREVVARYFGLVLVLCVPALLRRHTRVPVVAALLLCALSIATCVWNDGDWMPRHRLLLPLLPLVGFALALGLSVIADAATALRVPRALGTLVALAAFWPVANAAYYGRDPSAALPAAAHIRELGEGLRSVSLQGDTLATDMAGRLPYYSGLVTLDVFGLCDANIARRGTPFGHMGRTDWPYVFARSPTFYFYNFATGLRDMLAHPAFASQRNDYLLVRTPFYARATYPNRKILLVHKRRPDLDRLKAALQAELVEPMEELERMHLRPQVR